MIKLVGELGKWRPERFSIGQQYMEEYHKLIPKADPVDDWEDRNILYSMYEPNPIHSFASGYHSLCRPSVNIIHV